MASSAPSQLKPLSNRSALDTSEGRRSVATFLVCGMLVSFPGAILPSWGYHLKADFPEAGKHFLSVNLGFLLSAALGYWLLPRKGVKWTLVLAASLACASFLWLALCPPPASAAWRIAGMLWMGASAGLMTACVFQFVSPLDRQERAVPVNVAAVSLGVGCLLTALSVAGTYYVYTVPSILVLFAVVPGLYAGVWAKAPGSPPRPAVVVPLSQVLKDFRNPGAALFSSLLFFQFANEWSIGGWLSLFLIWRLGISPAQSLLLLALYWLALLAGRIACQLLLSRISHAVMLTGSLISSLLGSIVLASTNNRSGAVMGILFVGAGFAAVYPLLVAKIGPRLPSYHPGLFHGAFALAMTGGFLAPWLLGYVADAWGIGAIMFAPMLGACIVFVLMLLIMLETKLSGLAVRN